MVEITTLGIDLAKNIYQLHGVDRHGKSVLKKTISRAKLLETLAVLHDSRWKLSSRSANS